ncbi:recombinase family protein [Herbaspirillum seropedicae]
MHASKTQVSGILNNSMYVGQYVWNRSQWIKDPDKHTARRTFSPKFAV